MKIYMVSLFHRATINNFILTWNHGLILTCAVESSAIEQVVNVGWWPTVRHVLTATYHRHVTSVYRHDVIAVFVGGLRYWPERAEHCTQQHVNHLSSVNQHLTVRFNRSAGNRGGLRIWKGEEIRGSGRRAPTPSSIYVKRWNTKHNFAAIITLEVSY